VKNLSNYLEFVTSYNWSNSNWAKVTTRIGIVVFMSYLVASTLTAMTVNFFARMALETRRPGGDSSKLISSLNDINYHQLNSAVLERNIFNSDGEVPDETVEAAETQTAEEFNNNAPCRQPTLNVELIGIIYLGVTGDSLATIKEKGYNIADIYHKGDQIIGNDSAKIHDIEQDKVVVNNNGAKECLELLKKVQIGSEDDVISEDDPAVEQRPSNTGGSGGAGQVTLQASYVEESLGPGFAKILETGRLVPVNEGGTMSGFKLISVRNGSLWKKIGLNNGDVLTGVNGTSMLQPEQGFAFYQALQEEREIRLEYLRNGKDPTTVTIEIK
jgi:general secretion pathway protein C